MRQERGFFHLFTRASIRSKLIIFLSNFSHYFRVFISCLFLAFTFSVFFVELASPFKASISTNLHILDKN
jgi:hypothetical protein